MEHLRFLGDGTALHVDLYHRSTAVKSCDIRLGKSSLLRMTRHLVQPFVAGEGMPPPIAKGARRCPVPLQKKRTGLH
jgi:hypothetical protein